MSNDAEIDYCHEDDHNAHVFAWKHALEEYDRRWIARRVGGHPPDTRLGPREWLQYKRHERRRRNQRLDEAIQQHEKRFFERVSEAKPYSDYFTLLSLHTLLSGIFFALADQLTKAPWSNRSAIVLSFVLLYSVAMFRAFAHASDAFVDMAILKVIRLLNLPNPPDIDWRSFRAIWALTFVLLHWGVLIGSSFVGYDLSRRVIEQITSNPPVHNQSSPP